MSAISFNCFMSRGDGEFSVRLTVESPEKMTRQSVCRTRFGDSTMYDHIFRHYFPINKINCQHSNSDHSSILKFVSNKYWTCPKRNSIAIGILYLFSGQTKNIKRKRAEWEKEQETTKILIQITFRHSIVKCLANCEISMTKQQSILYFIIYVRPEK